MNSVHAWCHPGHTSGNPGARPWLRPGREPRVALLAAASQALHERGAGQCATGVGWLRGHVAGMLDLPTAVVEAEFADDQTLVTATIGWLTTAHLRRQRTLANLLSVGEFTRWGAAALLQTRTSGPIFGCEIGHLAREPGITRAGRDLLDNAYQAWERQLTTALHSLQTLELVRPDTDLARLATTVMSLLQGAYMTACSARDLTPIEATFDAAARLVAKPPA